MSYCSGCGSRFQEGDKVCKSCGYELGNDSGPKPATKPSAPAAKKARNASMENKPKRKKKTEAEPKRDSTPLTPEKPKAGLAEEPAKVSDGIDAADKRQLQSESIVHSAGFNDIHLGKGIIKPKAVEVGVDGYHFKYESQSVTTHKDTSVKKERSAEFHMVNQEAEPQRFDDALKMSQTVPKELLEELNSSIKDNLLPEAEQSILPVKPLDFTLTDNVDNEQIEDIESLLRTAIEAEIRDLVLIDEPELNESEGVDERADLTKATSDALPPSEEFSPMKSEPESPKEAAAPVENASAEAVSEVSETGQMIFDFAPVQTDKTTIQTENDLRLGTEADVVSEALRSVEPTQNAVEIENDAHNPAIQPERVEPFFEPKTPVASTLTTLWEGRQSWFGIPLPHLVTITEFAVSLTEQNGLSVTLPMSAIQQMSIRQSWLAKFLGIGDLVLDVKGMGPSRRILTGIASPCKIRSLIEAQIQKNKNDR